MQIMYRSAEAGSLARARKDGAGGARAFLPGGALQEAVRPPSLWPVSRAGTAADSSVRMATRALRAARREAIRGEAWERAAWLALALGSAAALALSFWK